jgi:hypothetical protein
MDGVVVVSGSCSWGDAEKDRQPRRIFITVTFSSPSLSQNSRRIQTQNNAERHQDANIGTMGMRSKIKKKPAQEHHVLTSFDVGEPAASTAAAAVEMEFGDPKTQGDYYDSRYPSASPITFEDSKDRRNGRGCRGRKST